jgi:hypothetical protein
VLTFLPPGFFVCEKHCVAGSAISITTFHLYVNAVLRAYSPNIVLAVARP